MSRSLFVFLILILSVNAQSSKDNWAPISKTSFSTLYLNTNGVSNFKGDDIYVWVMESYNSPITLEPVDGKIYKTKTYYVFNKKLKRYSFLQIIYYDKDNNVLKSFSYPMNKSVPDDYKYSNPIISGTNEEIIFAKILSINPLNAGEQK